MYFLKKKDKPMLENTPNIMLASGTMFLCKGHKNLIEIIKTANNTGRDLG
jgi:hypothetical protein